ncbi:MAG: response regulator [Gemmatimonadota bacterium]
MSRIRALIVDDEPLARERVRTLLEGDPDIEIVGECEDGRSAVSTILDLAPDLVFLDVQMPEMDGFQVLRALDSDRLRLPAVVFVTAYDQYAIRAFDVHAIDYLLKPFDQDRFHRTLEWVKERLRSDSDLRSELRALLGDVRRQAAGPERIVVRSRGRVRFVRVQEIDWVEAAGNYVRIYAGETSHLLRETMKGMERRLGAGFERVSRSAIVRVERITELQTVANGEYVLSLAGGGLVRSGRTYAKVVAKLIGDQAQPDEGGD